ncbi:MAG: hypothetical protein RLZZ449_336 [Actinomycetota bacterium]
MRSQVARVCEPWSILAIEPRKEVVGEEGRDAELRGPSRFGKERLLCVHRHVKSVGAQVVDPQLVWFGNEQLTIESREDAFERGQSPVVGSGGVAWICGLIRITEESRCVTSRCTNSRDQESTARTGCSAGSAAHRVAQVGRGLGYARADVRRSRDSRLGTGPA